MHLIYRLSTLLFVVVSGNVHAFRVGNNLVFQNNLEGDAELKNILQNILIKASEEHAKLLFHDNALPQKHLPGEEKVFRNDTINGCACVKKNCGCCAHIEVKKIDLNQTVCANVSYLPAEYGICVTVTLGRFTLINETISASNPPPICADIPHLKKAASICLHFHNLTVGNSTFKGCVAIEVRLIEVIEKEFELGCFTIPYEDTTDIVQSKNFDIHRYSPPRRKENQTLYFKKLQSNHSTV